MRRDAKASSVGPTATTRRERRSRAIFAMACISLLGLLAFTVAPAGATRNLESDLGSTGSGDGQLSNPQGVAVDQSTGAVYIADTGNSRVVKFDSSGAFVSAWGWGVQDGSAETQICSSGCQAGLSGVGGGQLATPKFIAVDNSSGPSSGSVYVGDSTNNVVTKFDSSGNFISTNDGTASGEAFAELAGIALDPTGNLWAVDTNGDTRKFAEDGSFLDMAEIPGVALRPVGIAVDSTGLYVVNGEGSMFRTTFEGVLTGTASSAVGGATTGLAFDENSDRVYLGKGSAIYEYEAAGFFHVEPIRRDEFGSGQLSEAAGLAVRTSDRKVFAAEPGADTIRVFGPPLPFAPVVSSKVRSVGVTRADVGGSVNPGNDSTSYRFEYGQTTAYGSIAAAGNLSADNVAKDVATAHLSNLEPDTEYHVRLVAENSIDTVEGPDLVFNTAALPSPFQLPDGRAWEMASPVAKNGGDVASDPMQTRAAADGGAVMFTSTTAFADAKGAYISTPYIAERGSDGWATHAIVPKQQSPTEYQLPSPANQSAWVGDFSADLSTGVFYSPVGIDPSFPNVATIPGVNLGTDLRSASQMSFRAVNADAQSPGAPIVIPGLGQMNLKFYGVAGASEDFRHIVFTSRFNLTSDAFGNCGAIFGLFSLTSCPTKLYEWEEGTLRQVGILPDGSPSEGSFAGTRMFSAVAGEVYTPHAISSDGSRVFFTAPPFNESSGVREGGDVYVRENHATTTQLNTSERSPGNPDPNGHQAAMWWMATPDGSKALITTTEELTDEDENGACEPPSLTGRVAQGMSACNDLYLVDLEAPAGERLTLLSQGSGGSGGVIEVLGSSDDGSYVYFIGQNTLITGQDFPLQNTGEDKDIYVWHDGDVKVVGPADGVLFSGHNSDYDRALLSGTHLNNWLYNGRDVRITSGGVLTYATNQPYPGYDNRSVETVCAPEPNEAEPERFNCDEVYVYDPHADRLSCASCNPTGAPPVGNARFTIPADRSSVNMIDKYENRAITDDGRRVFFSSLDALVPRDTNGRYDAYVYNLDTGRASLLSSGQCDCDSLFVDASADGRDAFFTTKQQLVRIDRDNLRDLYDARVGGGIAAQNAPDPALCEGDACQAPAQAPNDPTPASAGFRGPGNQIAPQKKRRHRKHRKAKKHASKRPHHATQKAR